jgi:hypothetical protein
MRKPTDSAPPPTAPPSVSRRIEGRLQKNFKISARMKPYAKRLRFRIKHLSTPKKAQRLAIARREMRKVLLKKKIRRDKARGAVAQTLDIAADHQLEVLRRDQSLRDMRRSQRHLGRLREQLSHVGLAISKLPPSAKGKLNKIVAEQDWENFDTETLIKLIDAMSDALTNLSPECIANEARWAINELRGPKHPAVVQTVRTAPPVILELWETIPAGARAQAEADLRSWVPPTRQPAMAFLNHLSTQLEKFRPKLKRGRRFPIERTFGERVAKIWHRLGVHVGRAFSGHSKYRGTFQRFTNFALYAVGDDSRLSNRQILNLKRDRTRRLR